MSFMFISALPRRTLIKGLNFSEFVMFVVNFLLYLKFL